MIVPASIRGEIGAVVGAALDLRVLEGKIIATPLPVDRRAGWARDAAEVAEVEAPDASWQGFGNEDDANLIW